MISNSWQEILIDFQALGGVAENIKLKKGKYGRGIFPVDPDLPSKIKVPEKLLIKAKYLYINNKEIKIKPNAPLDSLTRRFIDNYLMHISFGVNTWDEINEFENSLRELPTDVIELLNNIGALDLKIMHKDNWEEVIFNNFIQSRFVDYKLEKCLAPIFELVNHNYKSQMFSINK